ncbi:MAG: hypothetical protein IJW32_01670 [Clostridia bacterium]|nr:hypothetical protein [Clostridia bacterium]
MEKAKTLILNNKENKDFKAILNLKDAEPSYIKFFNLSNLSKNYALGIKQKNGVVKIPLKLENNNCQFVLPKSINFDENLFCAVVDVSNVFCPEIVLTGSINDSLQNDKIEAAFVSSKPKDTSVLYENLEEEQIEKLIDKNLDDDLNSTYYDACAKCKYRKAFYEGGEICCLNDKNLKENHKTNKKEVNIFEEKSCILKDNVDKISINNAFENRPVEDTQPEQDENIEKDKTLLVGENLGFYEQIKTQIDALFAKYPEEESLKNIISNSKWVRVSFNENNDYYVLGLVYNDSFERVEYISYGMPSMDDKNPPEDLKDFAQWLPIDFLNNTKGFWLVYQDALTGETIKINLI